MYSGMTAFRYNFVGGVFEIRTTVRSDGRGVAEIYAVEDASLVRYPYSTNRLGCFVRMTVQEAHGSALRALEERFGRPRSGLIETIPDNAVDTSRRGPAA
jgi:hypothetical protein